MYEKHPGQYCELSNRFLINLAEKSGIVGKRNPLDAKRQCVDKPKVNFGVANIDDYSAVRTFLDLSKKWILKKINFCISIDQHLFHCFSLKNQIFSSFSHLDFLLFRSAGVHRHLIVQSAVNNMTPEFRKNLLQTVAKGKQFKKVALVHVGKPPKAFIAKQQELDQLCHQKQLDDEVKAARNVISKKRDAEKKKKDSDRKAWEQRKQMAEQMGQPFDEVEPPAYMDLEDKPLEEEVPDKKAELDTSLTFRKHREMPDGYPDYIAKAFFKFALPTKEEGFDEIRFV